MYTFEDGKAYWFVRDVPSGDRSRDRFQAVASGREGDDVTFIKPLDLLIGRPRVIEGREVVSVRLDDGEYFCSAASGEGVAGAARVMDEIRRVRASGARV